MKHLIPLQETEEDWSTPSFVQEALHTGISMDELLEAAREIDRSNVIVE